MIRAALSFTIAAMLAGCGVTDSRVPNGVDHLVYGVADLDSAIETFEKIFGVRPATGGRHPDYGTHNALLSLGETTYLEIIAPDPEAEEAVRGRAFGLDRLTEPRLLTWARTSTDIEADQAAAALAGLDLGSVLAGSRRRPDGEELTWKLTDPNAMPFGGVAPFLIDWGETSHPAPRAPAGCRLVGMRAQHPDPEVVSRVLTALGIDLEVATGPTARLFAAIRTPKGEVELK